MELCLEVVSCLRGLDANVLNHAEVDMHTWWNAIVIFIAVDCRTGETEIADQRNTQAAAMRLGIGVFDDIGRGDVVVCTELFDEGVDVQRVAGNFRIAAAPIKSVGMQGHQALAGFQPKTGRACIPVAGVPAFNGARDGSRWQGFRNPVVDQIDDSTDRAAPVFEYCRSADDLDFLSQAGLEAAGVVGADCGGVVAGDAVLHQPHPRAGQPAEHR